MKTMAYENQVMIECRKMLGRIALFNSIYEFSDEFKDEAKKLEQMVQNHKKGDKAGLKNIVNSYGDFANKYQQYIKELTF